MEKDTICKKCIQLQLKMRVNNDIWPGNWLLLTAKSTFLLQTIFCISSVLTTTGEWEILHGIN